MRPMRSRMSHSSRRTSPRRAVGSASSTELPPMRETGHADLPRRADHTELHTLLVIVVGAVLRVGDADVHVEPAGEELNRLNREADDALGLDRHRDPVDEGVRPEDADAVVAIEVHAEDRIAHTLGVAVPDLDRGGLTRLEH